MSGQAQPERLKFLQVHTFYERYLETFYAARPGLITASYRSQTDALIADGFSGIHMLAPYLARLGYETDLIIANCLPVRRAWEREHGVTDEPGMFASTRAQIEAVDPDVLYLSEPITFDAKFLRTLSRRPRLILGWRAADIPAATDWTGFDVMLSNLEPIRQAAVSLGAAHGEDFSPGFPEDVAARLPAASEDHDVVFSGSFTLGQHRNRNRLLEILATRAEAGEFRAALHLSGALDRLPPALARQARPEVYGLDMLRLLRSGRIAFDARGDIRLLDPARRTGQDLARRETANMRIFEATGCGAFLLTEHHANLDRYFEPGREIETFSDERELIDKIRHYLAHPDQRREIAARGQARCLRDHSMSVKTALFDAIVRRHLRPGITAWEHAPAPERTVEASARPARTAFSLPAALARIEKQVTLLARLLQVNPGDAGHAAAADILARDLFGQAQTALAKGGTDFAFHAARLAKVLKRPVPGLDLLRALVFLQRQAKGDAAEALKEELRYFPDNAEARGLLTQLAPAQARPDFSDAEFSALLAAVRPYSMVGDKRLFIMYNLAREICLLDVPGCFAECGVAAGGSSALLASAIRRFSKRERLHYAFDSFEGMPTPTEHDTLQGQPAELTGWGSGTCAAPVDSLLEICGRLGVTELVRPVKGYFNVTLPATVAEMGAIALLHMDGDWYASTMDILTNLYDRLSPGAAVQIDDYGHWDGCRQAFADFFAARGQNPPDMRPIDGEGVWFQKG